MKATDTSGRLPAKIKKFYGEGNAGKTKVNFAIQFFLFALTPMER